ncbi:bifunctional protein FolD [Pseudonocardia sulfidoxydans NBRC 16205]|uniref:Bifunctional protein FolD n=1 Tax=Pseudonocardia sulfidoxydans NBRC 16205 TaxID=1223511 RepID=A0A511DK83_9PSEU|nr:bifunctional methylenetetrahydrofolate dehydrogenase/methenyltetrahydrofolate cyclohydrolase FolD [Pseudonocardia sulfidoxydans]GEL25202.1 bifunctional protein FolD [Pseudonocardia sulfidoxydans NBRC 16205]
MTAVVIDGREIARDVRTRAAAGADEFRLAHGRVPGLATVLVGDDPASAVYVANKRRSAAAAGIADFHHHLDAQTPEPEVAAVLDALAADDRVSGILLQLPLPRHLDPARLLERIPPAKDVDGLTTLSQGLLAGGRPGLRPCTPSGVVELLDAAGVELAGARAVVVGRSVLVGRPMAQLLLQRDATVTIAHSRTRDLASVTSQADILVAAAGVPGIVTGQHVKAGAAVIDVGIHRTDSGLVGDVAFDDVVGSAGWITPVPGGVGPLTIAMLLTNTVSAAVAAAEGDPAHDGPGR